MGRNRFIFCLPFAPGSAFLTSSCETSLKSWLLPLRTPKRRRAAKDASASSCCSGEKCTRIGITIPLTSSSGRAKLGFKPLIAPVQLEMAILCALCGTVTALLRFRRWTPISCLSCFAFFSVWLICRSNRLSALFSTFFSLGYSSKTALEERARPTRLENLLLCFLVVSVLCIARLSRK